MTLQERLDSNKKNYLRIMEEKNNDMSQEEWDKWLEKFNENGKELSEIQTQMRLERKEKLKRR